MVIRQQGHHGGQDLLVRCAQVGGGIEALRHTPLSQRALDLGFVRKVEELFNGVADIRKRMPDFVPIRELEGDVTFLLAEFAEMFFHRPRQALVLTPLEAVREVIQAELKQRAGINSMEEVVGLFKFARDAFGSGAAILIQQALQAQQAGGGSPLLPLAEQLVIKHVVTTVRLLVLKTAVRIETLAPEVCFGASTLLEVVPYLGMYPQAREEIEWNDLQATFRLLEGIMNQVFNDKRSATVFYTDVGNLAILLAEYDAARECYRIAARYAGEHVPEQITRGMQFVREINPQAKA